MSEDTLSFLLPFGPLVLGDLPSGKSRPLRPREIADLNGLRG